MGSLELDTELAAREEALLQVKYHNLKPAELEQTNLEFERIDFNGVEMQRQLALVQQKVRECEEIYRGDLQVVVGDHDDSGDGDGGCVHICAVSSRPPEPNFWLL